MAYLITLEPGMLAEHSNADSLKIARFDGWQTCLRISDIELGECYLFILPDDKVSTDVPEFAFLQANSERSWKRITVKRIRGELSQGLLIRWKHGNQDLDKIVRRYEPEIKAGGEMETPPKVLGASAHIEVLNQPGLLSHGDDVEYTAKIHGANARYLWHENRLWYGSKNCWWRPGTNSLWELAVLYNPWIIELVKANAGRIVHGEIYGSRVQGRRFNYGVEPNKIGFRAFELIKGFPAEYFVPVLYKGKHDSILANSYALASESKELGGNLREGIVARRLSDNVRVKYISEAYYSKG